jgi:hypothetical protein
MVGLRNRVIVAARHLEHQVDVVPVQCVVHLPYEGCHVVFLLERRNDQEGALRAPAGAADRVDRGPRDERDADQNGGNPGQQHILRGIGQEDVAQYQRDEATRHGGRYREQRRCSISVEPRHGVPFNDTVG